MDDKIYDIAVYKNAITITFNKMITGLELCDISQIINNFSDMKILINLERSKLDAHGYAILEGLSVLIGSEGEIIVNLETFADIVVNHPNYANKVIPAWE